MSPWNWHWEDALRFSRMIDAAYSEDSLFSTRKRGRATLQRKVCWLAGMVGHMLQCSVPLRRWLEWIQSASLKTVMAALKKVRGIWGKKCRWDTRVRKLCVAAISSGHMSEVPSSSHLGARVIKSYKWLQRQSKLTATATLPWPHLKA